MTRQECGYQGHVCGLKAVQFISRYRDENDYCVAGHRISLNDAGEFGESTPAEREAIKLFILNEYAGYIKWHVEFKAKMDATMTLQPFQYASFAN